MWSKISGTIKERVYVIQIYRKSTLRAGRNFGLSYNKIISPVSSKIFSVAKM
jgi:hypothetical protein